MQRITQWGEYGIHIALHLAERQAAGVELTGAVEISDSQSIALNYAQQILVKLKSKNIVESTRGPKGGYYLSKKPSQITLKEILEATEGATIDLLCDQDSLNHPLCSSSENCYLKSIWLGLEEHINQYLSKITLQDILLKNKEGTSRINKISQTQNLVGLPTKTMN